MFQKHSDPLLAAGKIMTLLLMAIAAIGIVVLIALIPALLFFQADFAKVVVEAGGDSGKAMVVTIIFLVAAALVIVTTFHFFQLLARLIDTVATGDPFTLENSARLSRMAWIALFFQFASVPLAALAAQMQAYVPEENLSIGIDFSLTGILLAIVLFILARVFKHGAAMRDDLEGTV